MLGDLLKSARETQNLSPGEFGDPEFSATYIDMLERGAVRPSPLALEFFASRAQIPFDILLEAGAVSQQFHGLSHVASYEEDLHYQLNRATALIHNSQVEEALRIVNAAETTVQPFYEELNVQARYRIPYTRSMAYLQLTQARNAQRELEIALRIIEQAKSDNGKAGTVPVREIEGSRPIADVTVLDTHDGGAKKLGEIEARVRNFLGVTYFMQKMLSLAEEQHVLCRRAVQAKKVTDQNLKFSIYRNLANDYWAAGKFDKAISINKEALGVFKDLADPIRLAGLHWGLAEAYRSAGDLAFAKLHLRKALGIYREKKVYISAAMLAMNLAEALMDDEQYPEAEVLLEESERLLEQEKDNRAAKSSSATTTGLGGEVADPLLLCNLYKDYAILARGQGELEKGAEYALKSTQLGETVYRRVAGDSREASAYPARHYAQALHIAALIEEGLIRPPVADQFFERAISVIEHSGFEETHEEILYSYGQVLKQRRDFERAVQYLHKAAQVRAGANRTYEPF